MLESPQSRTHWPLPLPYDLFHLIIFSYLDDCPHWQAIYSLSMTCAALAELCRPLKFRDITIPLGQVPHAKQRMRKLFSLLDRAGDISHYVRCLHITDDYWDCESGFFKEPPDVNDSERLSYFFGRDFRNMERLTLSFRSENQTWSRLPCELVCRLRHLLAHPTLHTVVISDKTPIPGDYLRLMKNILLLQLDGDLTFPLTGSACRHLVDSSTNSSRCTPHKLLLKDRSREGTNISSLLPHPHSPFNLSRLTKLEISARGPHIAILNDVLDSCSSTLEELAVYVATRGGLPSPFHPKNLRSLKALTLSVDVEMMPLGDMVPREAWLRFNWFVSALQTCREVAGQLEFIGLVLRIRFFTIARKLD
ncbi:hypothetical protein CPC08DRAFT_244305 [Agrocybe pediades]|nr:hypothetical protein CPC08DRAFT_244305 [Agrocybe pediades]